jgi:hypothetical protein
LLYDSQVRRKEDILRYGIEFSRGITAPLFERTESRKIGYWDQMLKTGEAYGRRLLRRGNHIEEVPDRDRDVSWTDAHCDRYVMRVGLYSRPINSSRNPWRERTSRDGPATQYFAAGDDDPW